MCENVLQEGITKEMVVVQRQEGFDLYLFIFQIFLGNAK
jgi:hypothetical protein